jgi:uncharacterized membrane protein YdbT with pleckstrin-like domain
MGYAQHLLAKDEQILYEGRQHWLAPLGDSLRPIVLVLVGLLVLVLLLVNKLGGPLLVVPAIPLIVGIIWIAIVVMTWRAEEYIITNRRVLKVEGLLDKKSGDSSLDKINDAVLKQGLLARMLGYGDLEILTANNDAIDTYSMLSRVVDFKKAMLNSKNDLEDGIRRPVGAAAAAASAPSGKASTTADVTAALSQLAELRDKGAITPAEYETKKAELLGRI